MSKTYININGTNYDSEIINTSKVSKDFRDAWQVGNNNIVKVNWQKARELFREKATIPKSRFCAEMVKLKVFTKAEARKILNNGAWHASMNPSVSDLSSDEKFEQELIWGETKEVQRNSLPVLGIIASQNIKPELMDEIFGYTGK